MNNIFELVYGHKQGVREVDVNYVYLSIDDKPSYAFTLEDTKRLVKELKIAIKRIEDKKNLEGNE